MKDLTRQDMQNYRVRYSKSKPQPNWLQLCIDTAKWLVLCILPPIRK